MLVIGIAMAIGAMTRFYLVSWLGERVSADLRSAVFNNLVHMQPSYFESNHSGEIMSRLTTDTTLLQTLIGSSVSLAWNALTLTGALTLMVITNLKLSLVILIAVPVTLLPILIFGRRVRKLSNKSQQTIAEVGSHAGKSFSRSRWCKALTGGRRKIRLWPRRRASLWSHVHVFQRPADRLCHLPVDGRHGRHDVVGGRRRD